MKNKVLKFIGTNEVSRENILNHFGDKFVLGIMGDLVQDGKLTYSIINKEIYYKKA